MMYLITRIPLNTLVCNKQVVNGFFWDGKPVANHGELGHPTALGVSVAFSS